MRAVTEWYRCHSDLLCNSPCVRQGGVARTVRTPGRDKSAHTQFLWDSHSALHGMVAGPERIRERERERDRERERVCVCV